MRGADVRHSSKLISVVQQEGAVRHYRSAAYFDDTFSQTGKYPTVAEAASEFAVSNRTV